MTGSIKLRSSTLTYIFAFILPITPWYFRVFGLSALNVVCLLYVVGIIFFCGGFRKIGTVKVGFTIGALFLIWFLTKMITFFAYGNYLESAWFVLRTVAVFYACAISIKDQECFLKVIKAILIASFIVCIFGLVEEVTHFNIFSLLKPDDYILNYNAPRFGLLRVLSFTEHTIVFSVYLMFCLGLCVYYMQFISKKKRVFYRILYVLIWVNIALSLSRSAMITTFISQILILYFSGKKEFLIRIAKIAVAILLSVGVLYYIVPMVKTVVDNMIYMILAVFNDDYTRIIASTFGGENLHAQGDRIDLYGWVISKMDGNWLFGHGKDGEFHYSYLMSNGIWTWIVTKENIEVQYLDIMFRYGVIGLVAEVLIYLKVLITSLGKQRVLWDKELTFNKMTFSVLLMYYVQLFAVNQTTERSLFYIIVFLLLIYNSKRFIKNSTVKGLSK